MKKPLRPKALLVQPPIYDFALYDLFLKPYGLLRIGRWLAEGGWDVVFVNGLDYEDAASAAVLGRPKRALDGTGKFFRKIVPSPAALAGERTRPFARYGILPEVFRGKIAAAGEGGRAPDLILLSTGMTYWYLGAEEAAALCRSVFPRAPLAAGGIYASLMPAHCAARTGADFVVQGEAEERLPEILESLGLPAPKEPFPRGPLLLPEIFRDSGVLRLNTGCPFRCDYCASSRLASSFVPGSPEEAFRTLEETISSYGTKSFAFYDDALLYGKKELLFPFLERVVEVYGHVDTRMAGEGPNFYLPNAIHVRYLDDETCRLLRAAGFRDIRLGFESASADFHHRHDGKFLPDSFPAAVDSLKAAGFPEAALSVYILAGLPGQLAEDVEQSVRFVRKFGLRVHLAEFSPVPGSRLWEECVRLCPYPLAEEPLFHNNSFFPLAWDGFSVEDLDRIKRLARLA